MKFNRIRFAIALCIPMVWGPQALSATAPDTSSSAKPQTFVEKPRPGRDGHQQALPPDHPLNGVLQRSKARSAARAASAPAAAAASAPAEPVAGAGARKPVAAASASAPPSTTTAATGSGSAAATAPGAAASKPAPPVITVPANPNFVIGGGTK
jgi:hypothetical protein